MHLQLGQSSCLKCHASAIGIERRLLHEEKESFEAFRSQVLQELSVKYAQLQVRSYH